MALVQRLAARVLFSVLFLPVMLALADKPARSEKLPPGQNVLWTDPGEVASLDFVSGFGGEQYVPQPPFTFVKEDQSGTNPKVIVKDAKGHTWSVKWGEEASPEVFCTRLVWACGYTVEIEHYVAHGQILGAHGLKRAAKQVQGDGFFSAARFQLRSDSPRFLTDSNWAWNYNPFNGTPQLNGLKILMLLVSNWDNKDARDLIPGSKFSDSNLAIFEDKQDAGVRYLYFVDDWGASMGKWGGVRERSKWDCKGYTAQSASFISPGSSGGTVQSSYSGKHSSDIVNGIRVVDVQWLMQYLGQITDDQIRRGLAAAGATPEQLSCYVAAVRDRIHRLKGIAESEPSHLLQSAPAPVEPQATPPVTTPPPPSSESAPATPQSSPPPPETTPAPPETTPPPPPQNL